MRLTDALLAFAAAHAVSAGPAGPVRSLTNDEILETMLQRPWMFPPAMFRRIQEKYGNRKVKRQNQGGVMAGIMGALKSSPDLVKALPNMLKQGTTAPMNGPAPKSLVPEVQVTPSPLWPGAKRVKVRYGPHRLPGTGEKNWNYIMLNHPGIATSLWFNVKKPCDEECMILHIESGLEYADGKEATMDTGAIFHHTVLLNTGLQVKEGTCNQPGIENIFMGGNERTVVDYALPGASIKSGYVLHKADRFVMNTELQNLEAKDKYAWQTVTYDVLDNPTPDVRSSQVVWLTIGVVENPSITLCHYLNKDFPWGPSNLTGHDQPNKLVFSEHSKIWRSDKNGYILQSGGHVHDGATNLVVFQNNKPLCDSVVEYTTEPGAHGHHGKVKRQIKAGNYSSKDVPHVKSSKLCNFPDGVPIKTGDTLFIETNYDLIRYPGAVDGKGNLDQVMGIAGVLFAQKN